MNKVDIYCDGSSRGNGQEVMRAGVAALLSSGDRMRAAGAYIGSATNQQAEIVAACVGLEALLRPCEVVLRSDSKYVVETMNGNFSRRANPDFWARLDLAASTHIVTWEWVRGRSGDRRQEACDKLARAISAMGEARDELLIEAVHRLRGENTPALVRAVMDALKYLAGACDGARKRDDHGFNKYDADAGHRLAGKDSLKDGELSLARRILEKYRAQLEQYDPGPHRPDLKNRAGRKPVPAGTAPAPDTGRQAARDAPAPDLPQPPEVTMTFRNRHFLFFAALALLGVLLVDSHSAFAQSRRRVVGTDDAAPVMKLFEGRSTTETLRALAAVRIPAFGAADRADILNSTSPRFRRSVVNDGPLVAVLKQRLKPVLALHGREGKLEIIVYDDDVPETQSVPGAFLAFSTGLLNLARSDGELLGVAARELAREYFTLPSAYARYTYTDALARRQERNLDAVTIATLLELKQNPAEYKALLRRIYERTPLDVGDDERAAIETAFAARLDAFNRLEVALKKPNKGKGRGNAG